MPNKQLNRALSKAKNAAKRLFLSAIHKEMEKVIKKNGGRVHHQYVKSLIIKHQPMHPWLTRDTINSSFRRYKARVTKKQTLG